MSLLQISIAGGVMILAVVVLRALALNALPKRTFLALWDIALIRLALPWSAPCVLSVYTLFERLKAAAEKPEAVSIGPIAPAPVITAAPAVQAAPIAVYDPAPVTAPAIDLWTAVWLPGALVCAVFFAAVYIRWRRRFRESLPAESGYAARWLSGHALRRRISIRQSDCISAPLTYGVLRPVILVPKSADWEDTGTMGYVLEHEYVHIRRFDAARKLLLAAAVCLHWFNPLVWCMYLLANRDIELACDEAVIHRLGRGARPAYAMALIRMEEKGSGPAPLLSGFGKNAVEERITALMKMKKTSVAALLVAVGLVVGMTTVFATSAAAEDKQAQDRALNAQTATAMNTVLSITDAEGKTWYSEDGGKTYVSEDEYEAAHPKTDVVWWTYDEYAAWLEQEKVELQSMLGERGWTGGRGEFVWTQEEIDRTIAFYEEILEQIGRGVLVSRTVNGSEDTLLMQSPYDRMLNEGEPTAADFLEYTPYGLEWNEKEKVLYYKGERVRYFIDGADLDGEGAMAIRLEYADAQLEGEIDVRAVRRRVDNGDGSYNPMGVLTGLEKCSMEEYYERSFPVPALEAEAYTHTAIAGDEENTAALLETYVPFGLSYEFFPNSVGTLNMSYKGKPVHAVSDTVAGVWIANSMNGFYLGSDAVDLEAVYENGKLTGLRESPAPSAQAAEPTTAVTAQDTGTESGEQGTTFAGKFEKYASLGIAYVEAGGASGKGNVYRLSDIGTNGKRDKYLISHFADIRPDGSVFTFDSAQSGGLSVQTVYGADGTLSGVTVTASPVTAKPLENGETVVSVSGLFYSQGWTGGGYVRESDFDPKGGLVPLYDDYGNAVGCFNNADSIMHDSPRGLANHKFIGGFICVKAAGQDGAGNEIYGYIREIDVCPDMGNTPDEIGEWQKANPEYGKRREIPLYDDKGNVTGSFETGGGITMPSDINTIDEARDYLRNPGEA